MAETTTSNAQPAKHPAPPPVTVGEHGEAGHEEGHHGQDAYPYVAHHFDTPEQQFEAGKLGIWLFLVTEVLFFSGLFCAYTIYRAQHPEIFSYAHYYLDTFWGALNTTVLILSSLTAAWAVRNAQLGQKKALIANIIITITCACVFLCIKYIEYAHKFHDGLLPGPRFQPTEEVWELETFKHKHPEAALAIERIKSQLEEKKAEVAKAQKAAAAAAAKAKADATTNTAQNVPAAADAADGAAPDSGAPDVAAQPDGTGEPSRAAVVASAQPGGGNAPDVGAVEGKTAKLKAADVGVNAPTKDMDQARSGTDTQADKVQGKADEAPAETASAQAPAPAPAAVPDFNEQVYLASLVRSLKPVEAEPLIQAGIIRSPRKGKLELSRPAGVGRFFGIYFFMTGLHGFHVLGGIIVWVWLLTRAIRGQFGPLFFGPIDFAALYWHLVDIIWIYLFPLLYLIH